jgi:hypothetical protein
MSVVSPEFTRLLSVYKDNYVAYRVTGNIANKAAYEAALNELNRQMTGLQQTLGKDKEYIQGFLRNYSNDNSELVKLHEQSQEIQKVGPKIQSEYEVSKRLNKSPQVQPIDDTYLYVKAGIVVALLVVVGIVGAL